MTHKDLCRNIAVAWMSDDEIGFLYYIYLACKSTGIKIDKEDEEVLIANEYDINVIIKD